MAQRRPLASFSTLRSFYEQQQGQQQGQQQQQKGSAVTVTQTQTTISERKKITIKRRVITTTSQDQDQDQLHQIPKPEEKQTTKKKITIKQRVVTTTTTTHSQEQQKQTPEKQKEKTENDYKTYITDYAPPATGFYQPRSDYIVPPPACSRFFIENKHCFLRRCDNACIDPSTKKVIGFWNEMDGKNCKLLPIEDETTYEEVNPTTYDTYEEVENAVPVPVPSPQKQQTLTNSRFVSDAQRARVACEPVALLREKLALQYGISKQRN